MVVGRTIHVGFHSNFGAFKSEIGTRKLLQD